VVIGGDDCAARLSAQKAGMRQICLRGMLLDCVATIDEEG